MMPGCYSRIAIASGGGGSTPPTPVAEYSDASLFAHYSFETDNASNVLMNALNITQVNDLTGNGNNLLNANVAQQPVFNSYDSLTGLKVARFVGSRLANTFAAANDYPNVTVVMVLGCNGNSLTQRTGRITKTGQNDFNGANSIAFQESRVEKANGTINEKISHDLCCLIYRIENGVGSFSDLYYPGWTLAKTKANAAIGSITFENVDIGMVNPNGMDVAECMYFSRKFSDAETLSLGTYMINKWVG